MVKKYAIIRTFSVISIIASAQAYSADLNTLINDENSVVNLSKGTYIINPSNRSAKHHIFSKGNGSKIIYGNGARLVFTDASIGGLIFSGFKNVVLKDVGIDWLVKPFSTAVIKSIDVNSKTVTVSHFDVSRLVKVDPEMDTWGTLFYDNGERVVAGHYDVVRFRLADSFESQDTVTLRIDESSAHFFRVFEVGQILTIVHRFADRHALFFSSVENVIFDNVEINSSPAMGIVVSDARRVEMDRVRIMPSSGSFASTNSDGVHILDSTTQIEIKNSKFFGVQDDGVVISTRGIWADDEYTLHQPKNTKCRVITESTERYTLLGNLSAIDSRGPKAYFCSKSQRREKSVASSSFRDIRGIGVRIASEDVAIRDNRFERITDQAIFVGGIFYSSYSPQTPAANVNIYENKFVTEDLSEQYKDLYGVIESACKPYSWCKNRNLNSAITVFDNIFTGNGARASNYFHK